MDRRARRARILAKAVAIVTGAGRGIGRAIAEALAAEGARVAVVDRDRRAAAATAKRIRARGGIAIPLVADVGSPRAVTRMLRVVERRLGPPSLLVNNAGVGFFKPLVQTTVREWDAILDTNLKGVFLCSRAVLAGMLRRRRGTIIHIASLAGLEGYEEMAAYCASKFGVVGLAQAMAEELRSSFERPATPPPNGARPRRSPGSRLAAGSENV
ncbi:MAG: SDR family NAD(P)-dependent oxidoreductase [Gemmatimonadetes bacterium]|nr:SDR family NAD(P)-dependent oxidoreductase [Gemmatimonadota bacterium]